MRNIFNHAFITLLIIYTALITLSYFKVISKYSLHFEIFAVILALFGIFALKEKKDLKLSPYLIFIALFLILILRIMPYADNTVPLGYDTGIYKYIAETYRDNLPNIPEYGLDNWIRSGHEHGLFILTDILYIFGFTTNNILIHFLIFLELLLGLAIYAAAKKFFNKNTAIISVIIYAVSVIQFKTFWYMYYKNITALILLLAALYCLKDKKYIPLIITASFMAAVHRPTFLIFALSYGIYFLINLKQWKSLLTSGIAFTLLAFPFYMNRLQAIIGSMIEPLIEANIGSGTFITFFQYQFLILAYLPFALFGFFYLIKKKNYNILSIWFIINFIIVYFKIIFYNRFIIHLDIAMIIMASAGIALLIEDKKLINSAAVIFLVASSFFIVINEAANAEPLVNERELNIIESLSKTEKEAYVMSTTSYYSPWLLGYSQRKTIAPGLFDYDQWGEAVWRGFYNLTDKTEIINLFSNYTKPIYLFVGEHQFDYIESKPCFELYREENKTRIYKYVC